MLRIMLSGAAVSWRSKRQPIVAQSTAEAEYIALAHAIREMMWLKQMSEELNIALDKASKVFCDNQSAIHLAAEDAFRERTKHIDIRYHYIRELVKKELIDIIFIPTEIMTADSLTKAVSGDKQSFCTKTMGLK